MENNATLRIVETLLNEQGELVIKKVALFDKLSGKEIRTAKITPQLAEMFKTIEIDAIEFLKVKGLMKDKNFRFFVKQFNLEML